MKVEWIKKIWACLVAPKDSIKKLNPLEGRLLYGLVFLVRFFVLALPVWIVALTGFESYWLETVVARLVVLVLNLLGYGAVFVAQVSEGIGIPGLVLAGKPTGIVWDCVGWKSFFAFIALVIAVPEINWEKRLKALWLLPVLFVVNILRIASVVIVGYYWPFAFNVAHALLWQWGLVLVVLLLWVVWLRIIYNIEKN